MGIQEGDMSQVWEVAYNIYEWPINILERGWKWMRGKKLGWPLDAHKIYTM